MDLTHRDTSDWDSGIGSILQYSNVGADESTSQVISGQDQSVDTAMASKEHSSVQAVKLDDSNYAHWRLVIEEVLKGNGLWPYVMGKVAKPAEDYVDEAKMDKYVKWEAAHSRAKAIILTSLDMVTLNQVTECITSEDLWTKIKGLKEIKSNDAFGSALTEFFNASWSVDETVASWLSKLAVISVRIKACKTVDFMDDLIIAKTLSSLPVKFSAFVQSWNMTSGESPTLDDFRKKLLLAERGITSQGSEPESSTSSKAGTALFTHGSKKPQYAGHKPKTNFRSKCRYCHKLNHKETDCWKKAADAKDQKGKPNSGSKPGPKSEIIMSASCALAAGANNIVADSAASRYIVNDRSIFRSIKELDTPVSFGCADTGIIVATHVGDIETEISVDGESWTHMTWTNVHYVPEASSTALFSTAFLDSMGYKFEHEDGSMLVSKRGVPLMGGTKVGETFVPFLRIKSPQLTSMAALDMNIWHKRLGHIHDDVLRLMDRKGLVEGLDLVVSDRPVCDACHLGRQTASHHPSRSEPRDCLPGQRLHSDVGFMNGPSLDGHTCYITFKDEATASRRVYFMSSKAQVPATVKKFLDWMEKASGHKALSFRSDNGTEYVNKDLEAHLESLGVDHEFSPPYTKQANGMAERENRTLKDTMRTLLFNADLTQVERCLLWCEAMAMAAYIRNRVPNRNRTDSTPYELLYGKKPKVGHLRVFGSPAFVKVPEVQRKSIDPKSRKTIFVGFDSMTDRHLRVYDRELRRVDIVSDVIVEDQRPDPDYWPLITPDFERSAEPDDEFHDAETGSETGPMQSIASGSSAKSDQPKVTRGPGRPPKGQERPKLPPVPHSMTIRSKVAKLVAMSTAHDPSSYNDAVNRADADLWMQAMDEEIASLHKNQTWTLEELPAGRRAVTCKWVFRSKIKPDGSLDRLKARLVARGFSQTPGVDYYETFSPVVQFASVRCILALAAQQDMEVIQFDIKTAFLYGPLDETVFMEQPEGHDDETGRVCRLLKSLYGLKQSPRNWFATFDKFLTEQGFKSVEEDPCVYRKSLDGNGLMILCLYVDDGLVCSTCPEALTAFVSELKARFEITSHEPSCYIGMELERDRKSKTIRVSQTGYLRKVLERFGLSDAKTVSSPLDPTLKLSKSLDTDEDFDCPYREAVGSLNYAACLTRPDISYSVSLLARFSTKPSSTHWLMVKRVMRYLKGTINQSLVLGSDSSEPCGFCDSDWAGDSDERKSTSGFIFTFHGGPVLWRSELQEITALSSTEAEYISLSEAMKQCLWLRPNLESLGVQLTGPTSIRSDNQGSIALSKNPEFHRRTKHIGARFHRIRQEQEQGLVSVSYVPTDANPADMLTKALGGQQIIRQLRLLNMYQ